MLLKMLLNRASSSNYQILRKIQTEEIRGIEDASPFTSIGENANLELLAKEDAGFPALTTVQNAINGTPEDIENPFPD